MDSVHKKRRVRLFYLGSDDLLYWLTRFGVTPRPGSCQTYPRLTLPEDARVLATHTDFARNAICFVVDHPSFDEVENGVVPPEFLAEIVVVEWPRVTGILEQETDQQTANEKG